MEQVQTSYVETVELLLSKMESSDGDCLMDTSFIGMWKHLAGVGQVQHEEIVHLLGGVSQEQRATVMEANMPALALCAVKIGKPCPGMILHPRALLNLAKYAFWIGYAAGLRDRH